MRNDLPFRAAGVEAVSQSAGGSIEAVGKAIVAAEEQSAIVNDRGLGDAAACCETPNRFSILAAVDSMLVHGGDVAATGGILHGVGVAAA